MSETSPARWHGNSGPGLGEITGVPASPWEGPLFWVGQLLFSPGQSRAPLGGHCNGWQGTLSQLWVGRTHSPLGAGCGLESPERSERQAVGGSGPLHPGGSVAPFWIGITETLRTMGSAPENDTMAVDTLRFQRHFGRPGLSKIPNPPPQGTASFWGSPLPLLLITQWVGTATKICAKHALRSLAGVRAPTHHVRLVYAIQCFFCPGQFCLIIRKLDWPLGTRSPAPSVNAMAQENDRVYTGPICGWRPTPGQTESPLAATPGPAKPPTSYRSSKAVLWMKMPRNSGVREHARLSARLSPLRGTHRPLCPLRLPSQCQTSQAVSESWDCVTSPTVPLMRFATPVRTDWDSVMPVPHRWSWCCRALSIEGRLETPGVAVAS
jgi:hypothetical protein